MTPHPQLQSDKEPQYPVTESELWCIYLTDGEGIMVIREIMARGICASHGSAPSEQEIRKKMIEDLKDIVRDNLKQDFDEELYITYQDFLWCISELRIKLGERE